MMKTAATIACLLMLSTLTACGPPAEVELTESSSDPLPSWNDGESKLAILDFVSRVTTPESPDFVPVSERIATFDKEGKPVGIQRFIGRRPIAAFGNSDGDFQMLEWSTSADGPSFGLFVHHDDAEREWAYDRNSAIGRLARGLDEAPERGWAVASIKNDWNRVYPWEKLTD